MKIFCSTAFKSAFPILIEKFKLQHPLNPSIEYGTTNSFLDRLQMGEIPDCWLLTHEAIKSLITNGHCKADSLKDICLTSVGVAIAINAKIPEINTEEAFIRAIKDTQSIAFTSKGASGVYFGKLVERLGLQPEIAKKALRPEGGLVGELVLQGKAEMAIQLISEIKAVKGIQLIGPLPKSLNQSTVFSIGTAVKTEFSDTINILGEFLRATQHQSFYNDQGLELI